LKPPNPYNKNSNRYISKPVQIRLNGHRSQMEIVILPVVAAPTRGIGLAGSQGKRGPNHGMFQRIKRLLAMGKPDFCTTRKEGHLGDIWASWTVPFSIGTEPWASKKLESLQVGQTGQRKWK
jgi:hypothetical protein